MTDLEFQYIKRAMETLESGDITEMTRAKILQTISEITGAAAQKIRNETCDRVDKILYQGA